MGAAKAALSSTSTSVAVKAAESETEALGAKPAGSVNVLE